MVSRQQLLQSVIENTAAIQRIVATNRDQYLMSLGINRAQLEALLLLNKQSPSIKYFAELMRVSTGAATQMVDSLAAKGFVERFASAKDGRSVNVRLTKVGQIKFGVIKDAYLERLSGILDAVSDEQLTKLLQATEQVLTGVNEEDKTAEKGIS
jgi:MarR family transcriptional regulator, organic hydroperoxide resistance regulator